MKRLLALLALAPVLAGAAPGIFEAIRNNDIAKVRSFLDSDPASATAPSKSGCTPLHYAASLDRQEAAYLLLKAGVSPDILAENSRTTPLHWAADANSEDVLRLLLKHKATVDARGKNGFTPLHLAARSGSAACVARLLAAGADPNATSAKGQKPVDLAKDPATLAAFEGKPAEAAPAPKPAAPKTAAPKPVAPKPAAPAPVPAPAEPVLVPAPVPAPVVEPVAAPVAPAPEPVVAPVSFDAGGKTPADRYEAFAAAYGTIRLSDNTLYNGGWSHGRFDGRGVHVINAEGERYEGEFRRGRRHGRGRYVYPNGDVLDCDWDDDVPDGAGSFTFATGGTVRGIWRNGVLREGSGNFSTTSGAQSFGVWRDGSLVSSQPVSR